MAYGFKIFDKSGRDITGLMSPIFFLDVIRGGAGSRVYTNQPVGKNLMAIVSTYTGNDGVVQSVNYKISGANISWEDTHGTEIIVYWG